MQKLYSPLFSSVFSSRQFSDSGFCLNQVEMKAFRSFTSSPRGCWLWHNIVDKNGRTISHGSRYCETNLSEKRRRFTTKPTSQQSSCKRIHVWEQTLASYAANSSPGKEDIRLIRNGLVLYKPLIINPNDNIN